MKVYLRNLLIFALLLLPVFGQAASLPSSNQTNNASSNSVADTKEGSVAPAVEVRDSELQFPVMRTVGGIGLVACLMIAAFFVAKKFAPRYFHKPASQRSLKIIETLAMGDKRSISLVEVDNSRFLVGNTPHQINLLAALPESLSLVSEPERTSAAPKPINRRESSSPFRNLFEVEKNRPAQYAGSRLPEDLRAKMRQLREALEKS